MKKKGLKPAQKKQTLKKSLSFAWLWALLMPVVVLTWGVVYYVTGGEAINVNEGFGWDGYVYGNLAHQFPQKAFNHTVDSYHAHRILPSAIVYAAYRLAGLPDAPHYIYILITFFWYNVVVVWLASIAWLLLARRLKLSPRIQWLGFIGLFANFAICKYSYYYVALTDPSAFTLALWSLYCYFSRRNWGLLICAALGYFTWPTAFVVSAVLWIFPRRAISQTNAETTTKQSAIARFFIASGIITLWLCFIVYYGFLNPAPFPMVEPVYQPVVYLSALLVLSVLGYIVLPLAPIIPYREIIEELKGRTFYLRLAAVIAIASVLWYFKATYVQITDPAKIVEPMTLSLFLSGSFLLSIAKPLLSYVAMAAYFGPVIILLLWLYPEIVHQIRDLGTGFIMIFTGTMIFSTIMTESRQLINVIPFLVVGLSLTLNTKPVSRIFVLLMGIISLAASKFWLNLNFAEMNSDFHVKQLGNYDQFPMQKYFMNHGPWMSMESYYYQGAAILLVIIILWWFVRFYKSVPLLHFLRRS